MLSLVWESLPYALTSVQSSLAVRIPVSALVSIETNTWPLSDTVYVSVQLGPEHVFLFCFSRVCGGIRIAEGWSTRCASKTWNVMASSFADKHMHSLHSRKLNATLFSHFRASFRPAAAHAASHGTKLSSAGPSRRVRSNPVAPDCAASCATCSAWPAPSFALKNVVRTLWVATACSPARDLAPVSPTSTRVEFGSAILFWTSPFVTSVR